MKRLIFLREAMGTEHFLAAYVALKSPPDLRRYIRIRMM